METKPEKKVVNFYLDNDTVAKLDAIAATTRHNRSTGLAFLVDQEYARLFSTPQPCITISEAQDVEARR